MKLRLILLASFAASLYSVNAWAAACCGGGSASPSTISNDDFAQLSASFSYTNVVVDNVDSDGYWRRFDNHQTIKTYKLQGASLISDRWQVGFVLPVLTRDRLGDSHTALGDIAGTVGYEILPDWDYHPFRPKGIVFLQVTLPSGISRYESSIGALDSTGNGFLAIGVGTLLTKTFNDFDGLILLEAHRSFSKDASTSIGEARIEPGFGGNFGVGAGYNLGDFRLGGVITWTVEDPVKLVGTDGTRFDGAVERYATGSITLSYMESEHYSGTLSYTDQTWFGNPTNTSLGRGIAIQIQRRWAR